jgi:hypothetical protein
LLDSGTSEVTDTKHEPIKFFGFSINIQINKKEIVNEFRIY